MMFLYKVLFNGEECEMCQSCIDDQLYYWLSENKTGEIKKIDVVGPLTTHNCPECSYDE